MPEILKPTRPITVISCPDDPSGPGRDKAIEMAIPHGSFVEVKAPEIDSVFMLSAVLDMEPRTIICYEFPTDEAVIKGINHLQSRPFVHIKGKHFRLNKAIPTPSLIFVTIHDDVAMVCPIDGPISVVSI